MAQRAKRIVKNPSGYHSHGKTPTEKVVNFCLFIKEFDWTGKWKMEEESRILKMRATRSDSERIDIEWPETQWWPDVWYTYAGYTIKCRNISHAAKIAKDPPNADKMRLAGRRARVVLRSGTFLRPSGREGGLSRAGVGSDDPASADTGESLIAALSTSVPWDRESTQDEVGIALMKNRNPTITWVNRISGNVHTATIKSGSRHNKISTNKDGKVIITFADYFGFHSVYVTSIIGVG